MFWCESMIQSQRQHTADMLAAVGKGKSLSTETTWTERPLNREEAMTPKDEKNSRLQENYLEEEVTLQSEAMRCSEATDKWDIFISCDISFVSGVSQSALIPFASCPCGFPGQSLMLVGGLHRIWSVHCQHLLKESVDEGWNVTAVLQTLASKADTKWTALQ